MRHFGRNYGLGLQRNSKGLTESSLSHLPAKLRFKELIPYLLACSTPPNVACARQMPPRRGGTIQKGVLYASCTGYT